MFEHVTRLPGVGPRVGLLIEKVAGPNIIDLCLHLPSGLVDRSYRPDVAVAESGRIATLEVRVIEHRPGSGRRPYRVLTEDDTGEIELVFFHARQDWISKQLPLGETRIISGTVERYQGRAQMAHPDYITPVGGEDALPLHEPVYPMTAGLAPKTLRKAIDAAVERVKDLPEWLDGPLKVERSWADWREALAASHKPRGRSDLEPDAKPRERLAYDELLANQLALALIRRRRTRGAGRALPLSEDRLEAARQALPFKLTIGQNQALSEVLGDMKSGKRMQRLLQGDVGSGKTVVAFLAALAAVENGGQAALMAPTDVLARQHARTLTGLGDKVGVRVDVLTGRDKGKARQAKLMALADGETDLLIGTHALFQNDVGFKDLALIIVDEQHRFGVDQRMALAAKGLAPHLLSMTATPIPRTLMLTAYGDMDHVSIPDKPPGRQDIKTVVTPLSRMDDVIGGVQRAMAKGERVYWICPLVEESETSDLAAAEDRADDLKRILGDGVALAHGQMKAAQRDAAMAAFASGEAQMLVATTVVEVGVDVPEATVIVIEHAERFGLAQLHQLRGRVGRGDKASFCVLLRADGVTESAKARLLAISTTNDGFKIAEEDLRLRGAGEVLGTRQSGLPDFRIADLETQADLVAVARRDVDLILANDPELSSARGEALRVLLYLFERDAAARYARTG
jgi:ATP-dependent DNA helicase RecG